MALRLNVTESWLSRYLDLARLPEEVLGAFPDPHALKIKHVTALKPLFKPDSRREKVLARGQELRESGVTNLSAQDVIRSLAAAADAPKRSGRGPIPRKSDPERVTSPIVTSSSGRPVLRVEKRGRSELTLTLLLKGGGSRADAEAAIKELLAKTWPSPQLEEPA